ncbi:MAG TPA: hypothetical protein VFZ93_04575, partial [Albitalea sp.]
MRGLAPRCTRRGAIVATLAALAASRASARDEPAADGTRWPGLRLRLFGERPIADDAGRVVVLEAPERAAD